MRPGSAQAGHRAVRAWRSLLREPLLQFLAIGMVVFGLYAARQTPAPSNALIEVTPTQVERLVGQFETVWRRPPTAAEREGLVDDYVMEEVYYREALALGLDRDDTVIRRRLRQKMEFIGDAAAGALVPDDTALRAHLEANPERFAAPAHVTFRQLFLGDQSPTAALAALARGADPEGVGRASLLPPAMEAAVETTVDGTFGAGFFEAVSLLAPGAWGGPVTSAYGAHLVLLEEAKPATAPAFAAVRAEVEAGWRQEKAAELRAAQYRALLGRYRVVFPADAP